MGLRIWDRVGCAGIQLVLEDDGRRLTVDTTSIGVALRASRRATGPASLHRPEPLLCEMARQSLVAEHDRETD